MSVTDIRDVAQSRLLTFRRDSTFRRRGVESWLLGGLNFQIEHHLFPRVCHVNYPAISNLVAQTCRDFGVRYGEHASFRAGLLSHFRWLRRMGARTAGGSQLVIAPEHRPAA
jgi:fatty acid desaturase